MPLRFNSHSCIDYGRRVWILSLPFKLQKIYVWWIYLGTCPGQPNHTLEFWIHNDLNCLSHFFIRAEPLSWPQQSYHTLRVSILRQTAVINIFTGVPSQLFMSIQKWMDISCLSLHALFSIEFAPILDNNFLLPC